MITQAGRNDEPGIPVNDARFALAVETSSAGLWDWSGSTGAVCYSSPFKALLGFADHELEDAAESVVSRLHAEDRTRVETAVRDHLSQRTPWEIECRLQTKEGEFRWFLVRGQAVWNEEGELARASGSMVDITARMEAEAEIGMLRAQLEHRLARLASLRKTDSAITAGHDLKTTLAIVLDQARTQLGVDAGDVLLIESKTQSLHHAASAGFRCPAMTRTRIPVSWTGTGRVVLDRRAIHVPNLAESDEVFLRAEALAEEGFVAYYAVPLVAKGEVKGILEVFHRSPLEIETDWVDFLETLAGQAAIAVENVTLNEHLRRANTELTLAYDATIEGWSRALDLRDKETEGHSQRVTEMTVRLARAMGVGVADMVQIRRGALLHDIGKMGIPDRILLKPGALTDEEWQVMRRHPEYAREMLWPIEFLRPALDIPCSHHEQWDGSGYPQGLAGEEIPLAARIFTLADIWDALSNNRPYRKAWSQARVIDYIASLSGTALDPTVVATFLKLHRTGLVSDLEQSTASSASRSGAGDETEIAGSTSYAAVAEAPRLPGATAPTWPPRTIPPRVTGSRSETNTSSLKILVADEHWPTAHQLKRMLEELGHEVTVARSARDAAQMVRREEIRVVFTDGSLPAAEGPDPGRRRPDEAGRRSPYVILTGVWDDNRELGLPPGADDFLAKPFDHREVAARMVVACRLMSTQEELLDRSVQAERMYVELRHQNERLAELVATDPLTGVGNRRHLLEFLESHAALSVRQERPLSVAILDVDHFKQFNDDFGHRAGDDVLCKIADMLRLAVRGSDLVARYGGEEFVVVMPMTDEAGSIEVSERLRVTIADSDWPLRRITASFGVATLPRDSQNITRLMDAADEALYRSKQRGRNCVSQELEHRPPQEGAYAMPAG